MTAHPLPLRLDEIAKKTVKYIPGSESYIVTAILKELLNLSSAEKNKKDKLPNRAELVKQLESVDSGYAKLIDPSFDGVKDVAQSLFDAGKVSFIVGVDFFKALEPGVAAKNLANIAMLLEALDKEVVTIHPLFDRSNQRGAWDMGVLPNYLPGYKKISDGEARKKYEGAWGGKIPSKDGKDIHHMLEMASDDKLGALYVVGEDILGTYPDRGFVERALNKTKLLIVQDSVLTDTAKAAHVVLPSPSFLESEGTSTNSEGRVQRLRKVFNTPFEAESNLTTFSKICMIISGNEISKSSAEVFNEVAEMVPAYDGLNFEHIGEKSFFCHTDETVTIDKFYIPEQLSFLYREETDYPFYLQSGNHLYHSDVVTQDVAFLRDLLNDAFCRVVHKGC